MKNLENKEIFSQNLQKYMKKHGVDRNKLCDDLDFKYMTVSDWINGKTYPRIDKIEMLADYFNINKSDLIEDQSDVLKLDNIIPLPNLKKIPLLGTIAAGTPILADENIEHYVDLEKTVQADFCLRVKGDSMINANIHENDIVFIKKQPDVDDGEIAAVLIDDEATLKRVYKIGGVVQLRAENPKYEPITLNGDKAVYILGKATYKISRVL